MIPEYETNLGRYLRESGTMGTWLADKVHVSPSTVSRWRSGLTCMRPQEQRAIREALEERASMSLDYLFDDQYEDGFRQ